MNTQDEIKGLVAKLDALRGEVATIAERKDPLAALAADFAARIRAEIMAEIKASPLKPAHRKPRSWTPAQKAKILGEIERARGKWGGVQAVLDKHEIVSANVAQWRQQSKAGGHKPEAARARAHAHPKA